MKIDIVLPNFKKMHNRTVKIKNACRLILSVFGDLRTMKRNLLTKQQVEKRLL